MQSLALLVVNGDETLDPPIQPPVGSVPDIDQHPVAAGIARLQPFREIGEVTKQGLLARPVDLEEDAELQATTRHRARELGRGLGQHQPVLGFDECHQECTPLGPCAVVQIEDQHGIFSDLRVLAQDQVVDLGHEALDLIVGRGVADELR